MGPHTNAEAGPSVPKTATTPLEPPPPGFSQWRLSLAQFTGLGLSEEEKAERSARRAKEKEEETLEKDWERCERFKRELTTRSESFRARS